MATPVEDGACATIALGALASHPMLAAPAAHQATTFSIRVCFLKIIGFLLRLASAARARDPAFVVGAGRAATASRAIPR
jgi:hypothetical protein